jgi:hypothetical protein
MSDLLAIQSVGGAGPNYVLTVSNSAGVLVGDHVVAPRLAGASHGAIYRVMLVPDALTINIRDDLVPGGGAYGAPTSGRSAYWTPTSGGLSNSKYNGTPYWGDITERDLLLLEGGLDTSNKTGKLIPGDFAGNPKKATVTFITAYPNTSYGIVLSVSTANDRSFVASYENKLVGGFTVNLGTNNIANLAEVSWETETLNE